MPLLKLSCASCSAPLEISEDLERFACGYCGTQQIVKRAGGAVWLKKIETAVRDVQKGTDRTAAELALVRLERELEEAQEARATLVREADSKRAMANAGRLLHGLVPFVAVFLIGPFIIILLNETFSVLSVLVWLAACVGVPVLAFLSIKLPPIDIQPSLAEIDARIAQIHERMEMNRAILDAPPA